MKQSAYIIILMAMLVLYSSVTLNAQSQKTDPESYKSQKEELLLHKENLLKEKQELTTQIAEMRTQLDELDIKLKDALKVHYIKKYGKKDGARVAMGQIWKGMTKQMMRDSWGEPDKTNTDRFSYGVFKQLYYGKVAYFFRDNKLIDWEEAK